MINLRFINPTYININPLGLYSWSTMVQCHIMTKIVLIRKLTMVNQGPTLHCDKYIINMKINNGKPWPTIFSLGFIVLILGFIGIFPWVQYYSLGFNIISLGLYSLAFLVLIHWVYYSL